MAQDIIDLTLSEGEWQRDYLFRLDIIRYPDALNGLFPDAANTIPKLDLQVVNADFQESAVKPIEKRWAGQKDFWGGPMDQSGIATFVFDIPRSWDGYQFFLAWKNLVSTDFNGASLIKPLYLGVFKLTALDVDKSTSTMEQILNDCWISKIDKIPMSKESDKFARMTISVPYRRKEDIKTSNVVA